MNGNIVIRTVILLPSLLIVATLLINKQYVSTTAAAAAAVQRSDIAAGLLLFEDALKTTNAGNAAAAATKLNLSSPIDQKLVDILTRTGPDMRPSRDYHDFRDISLEVSQRAWRLFHEHLQNFAIQKSQATWPLLAELLADAQVSNRCYQAIEATLQNAQLMQSWAIQMLNAWAQPFPVSGIFQGTYGGVGDFNTCVHLKNISSTYVHHAHFCSLTFRPVLPSRESYALIVEREPKELLRMFEDEQGDKNVKTNSSSSSSSSRRKNIFYSPENLYGSAGINTVINTNNNNNNVGDNKLHFIGPELKQELFRDALSDILLHAQYHHFVYYKLGSCWPIECSPFDIRKLAKLICRRNVLMSGPVKCYSLNSTDYNDEYQDESLQHQQEINLNQTNHGNNNNTSNNSSTTKTKKLVISIWDKNDGIFIWKPHFNKSHKIALSIIVAVSGFILIMSLLDLTINRMPKLCHYLVLCLKAMPLSSGLASSTLASSTINDGQEDDDDDDDDDDEIDYSDDDGDENGDEGEEQRMKGFSMVPTSERSGGGGGGGSKRNGSLCISGGLDGHRKQTSVKNNKKRNKKKKKNNNNNKSERQQKSFLLELARDCSIFTNLAQFFRVSEGQMRNDILCLNGIRCITMIWIIMTHTMMYNDWSAFARTREVEKALNSLISQPLFNGSYLVDTFFLMSGLLSAFTAFKHCQGQVAKFNSFAYIFGRWLRLTPQIFFVSMIYIVFPALSYGPHWFPIVGEYSENCVSNWWINVLHMQSFYKKEQMCNFVTWWISIDFFYHFFALAIIWIILYLGHKSGFMSMFILVTSQVVYQSIQHYQLKLPPNVLSTIPQTGAMWTEMTLNFFWTPYTHSVPFFFGFYIGYLMALKRKLILKQLNTRRALIGWTLSISLLLGQSYSTYWWVTGKANWSPLVSTSYYGACSIIWAASLCWIIIACHHGYGGFINRMLSWKVFIVLGKASYLVYLSHFQILFIFFGNQNLLLEPTSLIMLYLIFGNIFISTLWGILLCAFYELPWLKTHRRLMKYV